MSKNNDGKVQWNRRLSAETIALIEALAEKNQRSETNMIEVVVRDAAAAQGVTAPETAPVVTKKRRKVDTA